MRLILFAFLVGFSSLSHSELPEWMKHQQEVNKFLSKQADKFNTESINKLKNYSKLLKEEQWEYKDPLIEKNVESKRYLFHFSGVKVAAIYVPENTILLEFVEVTSPSFILSGGLKVGSVIEDIYNYFGFKGKLEEDKIIYEGESRGVEFHISEGRVVKIELYFYTG